MAIGIADSVGLSTNARSLSSSRSLESVFETIRGLVPQFRDGIRLFAIGAAVSASKMLFDVILAATRRAFIGEATFRGRDEAYRWILLLMMTQPAFQRSPRAVEVSCRPTLLVDYQADYRGVLNEDEVRATWSSIESKQKDRLNKSQGAFGEENDTPLGVHFFPATGENITFIFEGTTFWAGRQRDLVGDESWDESIKLSYLSPSSAPLRRLIRAARDLYRQRSKGRVAIYRLDRYANWVEATGIAKRAVESVHLPHDIKDRLLDDAKNFLSPETRAWYGDRGIPYRRGYLLFGVPGSGKSSLVHVLASVSDRPIYTLNLAASSIDDETFIERMSQVPSGALVLIEDIDAAFTNRSASGDVGKNKKGGISFSTLLNALDGVGAVEGRLLCMTTNYVEKLDSALIRPGRVDMRFEFLNASQEQAEELFLRWYLPQNIVSDDKGGSQTHTGQEFANLETLTTTIRADAELFSQQIPPDLVSVAAIQGFLLTCGKDHHRAVLDVPDWVEQQRQKGHELL